jgi:glycosyltransferase involved in cell wall biosynthesis
LLYTDDPESGGVAQYNHAVVCALVRAGYRVTCMQTRADNPLVAEQRQLGVAHEWIGYHTGQEFTRTLTDTVDAIRVFRSNRPDLILFSDCCPFSNLAARQVALRLGIPYVVVVGFVGAYLARNLDQYLPLLARQHAAARSVVAVSRENLQLLVNCFRLPAGRGEIIHYGRPDRFFQPPNPDVRSRLRSTLGIDTQAVVCLTAARLTEVKGFAHQLEAIKALRANPVWPRLQFVWIGEGEQRSAIESAIAQERLADRIHLPGHRWDAADWYDTADIFVLPSHLEGMPLAIMEAMAKRLPVVATGVSGIPEELGDIGELLPDPATDPAGVVQGLVETIARWADDPTARAEQGRRGHERAQLLFREELMAERTLALVARGLGRPTAATRQTPAPAAATA